MKKKIYVSLAAITCILCLTSCSFFGLGKDKKEEEKTPVTTEKEQAEKPSTTEEATTTEEGKTTEEEKKTETNKENPRENVAEDKETEFQTTGKFCGFADSNSVEIELEDGTYCTFFFTEEAKAVLEGLVEDDMPAITFTYKAKDGQVNPQIISVD